MTESSPARLQSDDANSEQINGRDVGALSLALVARVHGVAADPAAILHQSGVTGRALDLGDLTRAARALGLKARLSRSKPAALAAAALPALAELADGRVVVLARASMDKVLIQDPALGKPETQPLADFATQWTGRLLLIARRAGPLGALGRFDVRWFVPVILKHKHLFAEVLAASLFLQLFALITPLFFQVVVDKVLVHRGLTTLDVLVIGLAVVTLFEVLLGGLRTYVYAHTTNRVDVLLGARLYAHLLALPMAYFEARRVGDSVARARALEQIREFLTGNALTAALDLLFAVVFIAVMLLYSAMLTLVVLGAIPIYVAISAIATPIFRRRLEEKFERGAENQSFLVESVGGVETLKSLAVEPQMRRRWEEQLAAYVQSAFRVTSLANWAGQSVALVEKAATILILWLGARLVVDGDLTIGGLVAFNMLAQRVSQPVLRIAHAWQDFQQVRVSVERLGDILNTPTEPAFNPGRASLPRLSGRVDFDHVTFRYRPDGKDVLTNVSLAIPPGQVVGIVGPSGSGKSTLAKLVQRLHVPQAGRVLVDGVDIAMADTAWLRRQIGVVLQENVLFNRSVRENIALADPGLPMEQVVRAAKLAGAHDFILELPEGYDTQIGERGGGLSGGQRQRIAIARALIGDPRILIFDEATSALDYESERVIQENMRAICRGRTVIIIAHRLAAVRPCNLIVALDKGRIVEAGAHDELIRHGGLYARLYALQSGGIARPEAAE